MSCHDPFHHCTHTSRISQTQSKEYKVTDRVILTTQGCVSQHTDVTFTHWQELCVTVCEDISRQMQIVQPHISHLGPHVTEGDKIRTQVKRRQWGCWLTVGRHSQGTENCHFVKPLVSHFYTDDVFCDTNITTTSLHMGGWSAPLVSHLNTLGNLKRNLTNTHPTVGTLISLLNSDLSIPHQASIY